MIRPLPCYRSAPMGRVLERAVRRFVAEGSGLGNGLVIEGNSRGPGPKDPYASVLLIDDVRRGYPVRRQLPDGAGTAQLVHRRALFSVQFYRPPAVDLAERFDDWAMSETGLLQAETAFSDGRIAGARVLRGGTGFAGGAADPIVPDDPDGPGLGGQLAVTVVRGAVAGVAVARPGENYWYPPDIVIASPTGRDEDAAVVSVWGYGFRVVFPLRIRRLDEVLGDAWETRAQIDLGIDYAVSSVQPTGCIDTNRGFIIDGQSGDSLAVGPSA